MYPQMQTVDPLYGYFSSVAGQDQQISAIELGQALSAGKWRPFSISTCRLMLGMLDRDCSGKMGFEEFKELWGALAQWQTTFNTFDKNNSGFINFDELKTVFSTFEYDLSDPFYILLMKRYDRQGDWTIAFDDFVQCCIVMKSLTSIFRQHDANRSDRVQMDFYTLMICAFST